MKIFLQNRAASGSSIVTLELNDHQSLVAVMNAVLDYLYTDRTSIAAFDLESMFLVAGWWCVPLLIYFTCV
jgi:hypothetical protein